VDGINSGSWYRYVVQIVDYSCRHCALLDNLFTRSAVQWL